LLAAQGAYLAAQGVQRASRRAYTGGMNIASLKSPFALRLGLLAASLSQPACSSDLPAQDPNLREAEHAPTPPAKAGDDGGQVSERTDARVASVGDAALLDAGQQPRAASGGGAPFDAAPPNSPAADAALVAPPAAQASDAAASSSAQGDAQLAADTDAAVDLIDEAFAALRFGQAEKRQSLIDRLDERVQQRPEDGYAVFYSGAFRFWKFVEGTKDVGDLVQNLSLPEQTLERFARADELMPDDFRVPGFYGMYQVIMGMLAGNAGMKSDGLQTLDRAIALYPAYGYFLRASATSGAAVDDPIFATALDDMESIFRECLIERSDGEVTYPYPLGPKLEARPHVCLNDSIIPHVWEGMLITFGDMAAKAGWEAERVRALYRSARTAPNYADWPFVSMLEARIEGAEERVRLLTDANPLNDPASWGVEGHLCTGCHQER